LLAGYRYDHDSYNTFVGARRYNGTILDNQYITGGDFELSNGVPQGGVGRYAVFSNPFLRTINSFFGRLNYSYSDKYLMEFTFRYDGSSVLAPQNRYFFYPAVSLGWRLTNETFMETIRETIGEIKLRYSIGKLGNQNIPNGNGPVYLPLVSYNAGAYTFNNTAVQGTAFSSVNADLNWEQSTMANYGIDYTIPNSKITASFDFYNKKTTGMLLAPTVPSAFGLPAPVQNFGSMQTVGWEFSVKGQLQTGPVNHNFGFNLSDNTNKLLKIGPDQIGGSDFAFINREGYSISSYYLLRSNGLYQNLDDLNEAPDVPNAANQTVQPGDIRYVDKDGDGKIDVNDRYVMGNPFPRYTFGFTYSAAWKNFDFQMFWQGVGQRSQYLRGDIVEAFHNNEEHAFVQHLDRWTPTNPNATYPRLTASSTSNQNNISGDNVSDYWLYDTKYLRLKNVQIGYTLPQAWVSKAHFTGVRIYFSAQNLLTFTPERFRKLGVDPEFSQFNQNAQFSSYSQIAGRNYPNAITMSAGIDLKF
jgi:TonB-linked SusC/RagA family outer membrane protein